MFKRINKRLRKKEKEEAAGLDDETKQVLGMHDTDSDESDSGSSSGHDSSRDLSDSDNADTPVIREYSAGKRRREVSDDEDSGPEDEGEDDTDDTAPPMSVSEALSNPLYPVRTGSDAKVCILCPGKELKHSQMVSVHVASSTHLRRMKRFATLAARVGDDNEDPRLLVAALDESVRIAPHAKAEKPVEPQMSKRERRMAKRQRRRERRDAASPPKKDDKEPRTHSSTPGRNVPGRTVIQTKIARKRAESVKRHKMANPRKSGHLRKNARLKTVSV
ncbi:hypothetical protein FRC06_009268 [Ceratobasidium sp. 370]|nr:hypothetical protein FRC06_009268 [Ceratobasidium sp. 370]